MEDTLPLRVAAQIVPDVAMDWGGLADSLAPDEFASVVLAEPTWRKGGTPAERFYLLQEQMRAEIHDATAKLREGLLDANPKNDWIIIESFAKRVRGSINHSYYLAYQFGRETSNPFWLGFTQADMDAVRGVIETEYEFLRGFTADLRDQVRRGETLSGRLEWRADLYGKSLTKAYQMGLAAGDDTMDMITILPGRNKDTHCAVCPTHWGTWTRLQYETGFNPPMPPANRCEGKGNCHCVIHQRAGRLPTIDEMARAVVQGPMGENPLPEETK